MNVASGDLFVSQDLISLAGVTESLNVSETYNSLANAPGSSYTAGVNQAPGWLSSTAPDVHLLLQSDGTVAYYGPSGYVQSFLGNKPHTIGVAYETGSGIDATLTPTYSDCRQTGQTWDWVLWFHQSGGEYCFDQNGILRWDEDRYQNKFSFAYGTGSTLSSITGTRGASRILDFADSAGLLSTITQPDAGGDPGPRGVSLGYTSGQLTSITDANGNVTTFGYGTNDTITKITDAAGHIIKFIFDTRNRVIQVTQDPAAVDAITTLAYTNGVTGNTVVTDPDGNTWTYDTDYADRVLTVLDEAHNQRFSETFNSDALPFTTNNGAGTKTYTYAPASPEVPTSIADGTGSTDSYAYDEISDTGDAAEYLASSATDTSENTSTFGYDTFGGLQQTEDTTSTNTSSVDTASDGELISSTDPKTGVTTFEYTDGNANLNQIVPPTGSELDTIVLTYDDFGRVQTEVNGDGVTETISYDSLDRVIKVVYSDSTPTATDTYDANGNLLKQKADGITTTDTYDQLDRLKTEQSSATGAPLEKYSYDNAGNMVSMTDGRGTTTYGYNDLGELSTMVEGSTGNTDVFRYNDGGERTDSWYNTDGETSVPPTTFALHLVVSYTTGAWNQQQSEITATEDSSSPTEVEDLKYCYIMDACATGGVPTTDVYTVTNTLTSTTTTYTYDSGCGCSRRSTPAATPSRPTTPTTAAAPATATSPVTRAPALPTAPATRSRPRLLTPTTVPAK